MLDVARSGKDASISNTVQIPFAKALEEATGYEGYTDYVLGKSYLGKESGLAMLNSNLISVQLSRCIGCIIIVMLKII